MTNKKLIKSNKENFSSKYIMYVLLHDNSLVDEI